MSNTTKILELENVECEISIYEDGPGGFLRPKIGTIKATIPKISVNASSKKLILTYKAPVVAGDVIVDWRRVSTSIHKNKQTYWNSNGGEISRRIRSDIANRIRSDIGSEMMLIAISDISPPRQVSNEIMEKCPFRIKKNKVDLMCFLIRGEEGIAAAKAWARDKKLGDLGI